MSVGDNLLYAALLIGAVLYWIHYVKVVRNPKNESWWDSPWSIGSFYIFPFGSLICGSVSATVLLVQLGLPEVVGYWLVKLVPWGVILCGAIAFLGLAGVPLPYPFLPKWAVKKQKEEWATAIAWLKGRARKLRKGIRSLRRK
ncbi:hypothetical protein J2S67_000710 [Pseudoglutamicibacter albus]|uniref:Uncharacterized protein n=1 Tax=Pseudoglutamicibacter albus TaxID=98671 RepID=A0ABU1YYK9_9MICC|nr:hypothetical protein [Pseudoglutamicibacter albus]MDR7293442.1 hypothetical protein [Pseudoglutamicibacter albus]